jgi:hypothetical protein
MMDIREIALHIIDATHIEEYIKKCENAGAGIRFNGTSVAPVALYTIWIFYIKVINEDDFFFIKKEIDNNTLRINKDWSNVM